MTSARWYGLAELSTALFLPTVLFVLVANSVILPNLEEISYGWSLIGWLLVGFSVSALCCCGVFFGRRRVRLLGWVARLCLFFGISVLLWDSLSLLFDPLGGSLWFTFGVESLVGLLTAMFLFRLPWEKLVAICSVVTPVFLLSGLITHVTQTRAFWTASLAAVKTGQTNMEARQALSDTAVIPLDVMVRQESIPLSDAIRLQAIFPAYKKAEVSGRNPARVTTSAKKGAYAAKIPFTLREPLLQPGYLHIRAHVLSGRVSFGILSHDQKKWLAGTQRILEEKSSVADMYLRIPRNIKLGPLVISNAVAEDGNKSIVEIFYVALNVVKDEVIKRDVEGNVYHLIFDAYQSEAYQYVLREKPEITNPHFTYYPHFRSNSGRTWSSNAELVSGAFYTPDQSISRWANYVYKERGLFSDLIESGHNISLYPHYRHYCHKAALVCKSALELMDALLKGSLNWVVIDLWFLKIIPHAVRHILHAQTAQQASQRAAKTNWDYGFSLMDTIGGAGQDGDPKPQRRDISYFAVQQFEQFLADEPARPSTGQYVFVHMILPHDPHVVDGQCRYVSEDEREGSDQERYLRQVECAHHLVKRLVDRLQELGRFDSSLILVHGDHGYYWHPSQMRELYQYNPQDKSTPEVKLDEADSATWASAVVDIRSATLLMIKWPYASAAKISVQPVQTIDLAPTILRYFQIGTDSYRGTPVQDMATAGERARFFFAANAIPQNGSPSEISRYQYRDGQWQFREKIKTLP